MMSYETSKIKIIVNGESQEINAGASVADLIIYLQLAPERVAIEHNREILSHRGWATTQLQAGDRLEIVHFVGGG